MDPEVLDRMKQSGFGAYAAMNDLEAIVEEQQFVRYLQEMEEKIARAGSEEERKKLQEELEQFKSRRTQRRGDEKKQKTAIDDLLRALFGVKK